MICLLLDGTAEFFRLNAWKSLSSRLFIGDEGSGGRLLVRGWMLAEAPFAWLLCFLEFGVAGNARVGGGRGEGCTGVGCIELGRDGGKRKLSPCPSSDASLAL
jgi:hypothetical protein